MGIVAAIQTQVVRWWLWFKGHVARKTAEPWFIFLSFLEAFVVAIPVDPFLAAMVFAEREKWIRFATIATVASTVGAVAGYAIGYFAFDLIGSWFLSVADRSTFIERMTALFTDNVLALTFAAALTPIPNAPIVLAGGFVNANLIWFTVAWFFGRVIRFFGVAYVAYAFGMTTLSRVERALTIGTILLVLVVLSILAYTASGASQLK